MLTEEQRRKVVDRFLTELESVGKRFRGRVEGVIVSDLTDREIAELFAQIDFFDEINQAGYLAEVEQFMKDHEDVITEIYQTAKDRGVNFTVNNLDMLDNIMNADTNYLLRRGQMFGEQFKSAILKPLLGGATRQQMVNEFLPLILEQQIPFKPNWLDTAINQSFTAFDNVATQEAFRNAPETRFVLEHPVDINTRRVCKHAVMIQQQHPEGFTIDEINSGALTEGFIPKSASEPQVYTFENLGGFNCRGFWALADE